MFMPFFRPLADRLGTTGYFVNDPPLFQGSSLAQACALD
jgi:hypothetical protein